MLTDEIDNLKNKIAEHKIQRDLKLKEINELNVKLEELQNQYDVDEQKKKVTINELSVKLEELQKQYKIDEQKKVTINKFTIISLSAIIIILIIYIFLSKKINKVI
jgi:hypothetical protein